MKKFEIISPNNSINEKLVKNKKWQEVYEYRVTIDTDDPYIGNTFKIGSYDYCDVCKEFHRVPFDGYIRERIPLRIAKNWSIAHRITTFIERRKVKIDGKLSGKSWINLPHNRIVQYLGDWELYKKITKFGQEVEVYDWHV